MPLKGQPSPYKGLSRAQIAALVEQKREAKRAARTRPIYFGPRNMNPARRNKYYPDTFPAYTPPPKSSKSRPYPYKGLTRAEISVIVAKKRAEKDSKRKRNNPYKGMSRAQIQERAGEKYVSKVTSNIFKNVLAANGVKRRRGGGARAPSEYNKFISTNYASFKASNPGMKPQSIMKELAADWRRLKQIRG